MEQNLEKNSENDHGETFFEWEISEYEQQQRGKSWYIAMICLAVALIAYSVITVNFLFALIVILGIYIFFLRSFGQANRLQFKITEDGIAIGGQFVEYSGIKNFYIIYKPGQVKKLYFNLKGLNPDIAVNLEDNNPLPIRQKLLEYLTEDKKKEERGLSEELEEWLKL